MTDNDIIEYYNNYYNTHKKTSRIILDLKEEYKTYLENRFEDSESILESLYRIITNKLIRPTCKICGDKLNFINISKGFSIYCSTKCVMKDPETIDKLKENYLLKYGTSWFSKSEEYREKIKQTSLNKYGVEHFTQSDEYKENFKNQCLNKYGVDNIFKSEIFKSKAKQTCIKKYGVDNISKLPEISKRKSIKMASKESQEKHNNSMKLNNSYGKSKEEDKCYELLITKFNDVKRQYRDQRYPFNCDFYIPSLDLFIEYNGSHFHHYHIFDKDNIDDINELNRLKNLDNGHNQYSQIILTWTKSDPLKLQIAKNNKLNYLFFYNLKDFKEWFNAFEYDKKEN